MDVVFTDHMMLCCGRPAVLGPGFGMVRKISHGRQISRLWSGFDSSRIDRHRSFSRNDRAFSRQRTTCRTDSMKAQFTKTKPHFSDLPLDRAGHLRKNDAEISRLLSDNSSLTVIFVDNKAVVAPHADSTAKELRSTGLSLTMLSRGASIGTDATETELKHHDSGDAVVSHENDGAEHINETSEWPLVYSFREMESAESRRDPPKWNLLLWPVGHSDLETADLNREVGFIFLGLTSSGRAIFACQMSKPPRSIHIVESSTHKAVREDSSGTTPPNTLEMSIFKSSFGGSESSLPSVDHVFERSLGRQPAQLVNIRSEGQKMAASDAAVLALAAGLIHWHHNTIYCGRTGSATIPQAAGHARRVISGARNATNSSHPVHHDMNVSQTDPPPDTRGGDAKRPTTPMRDNGPLNQQPHKREKPERHYPSRAVYPRIDPAVIVGVSCGDWMLLGRKSSWGKGRYSLLAGFAEVGETLEAAVEREVFEESGVFIDPSTICYHSSQPWPFPQSLMIGFMARSRSTDNVSTGDPFGEMPEPAHRAALQVGLLPLEAMEHTAHKLPDVRVDEEELEDARWFHKSWLASRVALPWVPRADTDHSSNARIGVTSNIYMDDWHSFEAPMATCRGVEASLQLQEPKEGHFRIPGKHSLANRIIRDWLIEHLRANQSSYAKYSFEDSASSGMDKTETFVRGNGFQFEKNITDVSIDCGIFKYVLLRLVNDKERYSKLIVRGDSRAPYHSDIYGITQMEVEAMDPGLRLETVGGGRMNHVMDERMIHIYGYSVAFGQAPHDVTADIIRRAMPFHDVVVSYEGY